MKKLMSVLLLTALVLALAIPAFAAGSKTNPVEIVETLYEGEHQDWTENDPSAVPTPEDASEAAGIPAEEAAILWTLDYDTENFPVEIKVTAPGTDDRTLYVLAFVGGEWIVIGSGVGPTIRVPVTCGGTLSLVADIQVLYEVTKGMGGVWYRQSNVNLPFTCERNINDPVAYEHWLKIDGIKVDGVVVDPSNYSAVSGSVVLELYPSYLSTLELGEHKLTFCFDDGNREASTNFFVREGTGGTPAKDQTQTAPKTGENGWIVAAAAVTVAAFGGALALKRRREQ